MHDDSGQEGMERVATRSPAGTMPVNLFAAGQRVEALWSPRVLGEVNGLYLKVARLEGEFVWHDHPDSDELFLVLTGRLVIELEGHEVSLRPGDVYVVAQGVRHRPCADPGTTVALLESAGVTNTGASGGPLTAPVDEPL